jgi:hypothetical protein
VTAEARAFSWLETVAVDTNGTPAGSVRRLTPTTGHVSAFDVAVAQDGTSPAPPERGRNQDPASPAEPAVVVVARDDGEAVDGSGGALQRLRVGDDVAEGVVELPTDGLGRGVPSLLGGPSHLLDLTWVDAHERLRYLPLDASGSPAGPSSVEDGLGDSRLVLRLDREQVLAERRSPTKADLEIFACPR